MADWKEILSDNEEQLSDEDLLKYLDENTPEEEKYAIEKKLAGTSFESDAVDGLQQLNQPGKLNKNISQLNKQLQRQLNNKKQRKEKGKVISFRWILLTILLLLFICIIGFLIIHLRSKGIPAKTAVAQTEQRKKAGA